MNNAFEKTAVLPKCDKGSANSTQINLSCLLYTSDAADE